MLDKNYCNDVSAVLVAYNPNSELLVAVIQAVLGQVSDIFIVDNASSDYSFAWLDQFAEQVGTKLHLLKQEENLGIGAGHNVGIKLAIARGSKFVMLLDQDSLLQEDVVVRLRAAYNELSNIDGFKVAALGPQYRDSDTGALSDFVRVGLGRNHFNFPQNPSVTDADFLVSSGSLLSVAALEVVGLMDESLFIDGVDTEWCFRAKSKGFLIVGLYGTVMTHALGEQRKEIPWFFRKRAISVHKPFRYYYMYRNSVLLYCRSYTPWGWKFADMARCCKMAVFLCWAGENRLDFLKMIGLGIIDGLKGVSGRRHDL
jgi:rhamnosyltransferase